MTMTIGRLFALAALLLFAAVAHAGDEVNALTKCRGIKAESARLSCYDAISVSGSTPSTTEKNRAATYEEMDLTDLKVDAKSLKGRRVATRAYIQVMGEMMMLKSDPMDMAPIWADASSLPRDDRKKLASGCQAILCQGKFAGTVKQLPLGMGITLDRVEWD